MKERIFIVGGGPSLKGFDFSKLANEDTIAINDAAMFVPDPTFCITADSRTFRRIQDGYFKKVNTTWVLVTNPNHCSMKWEKGIFKNINTGYIYNLFCVNMIIRNNGTDGIGFSFNDFRTGYNSGFCGFQLAVLLGYKQICLLGIDLIGDHCGHFYNDKNIPDSELDKFYNNFVIGIETVREQTDIEIISCSQISRLNEVITYKSFDDIISNATNNVDVKPELVILPHKLLEQKDDLSPKKLSILICSIKGRESSLNKLLVVLDKQKTDDVEILIEVDDKQISIGAKRNILLKRAKGDYISFVDDDDMVAEDYVSKILKAIETNPDCCGVEGYVIHKRRRKSSKFIHSIQYKEWFEKKGIYYRCPNHLSPVRRELALRVMFPNLSYGEDRIYSNSLLKFLKTEVYIDGQIYYYQTI